MQSCYVVTVILLVVAVVVGYYLYKQYHPTSYHQGAIDLPYLEHRWIGNVSCDGSEAQYCPCGLSTCGTLPAWKAMTGSACRDFHNKGPQHIVQHPIYQ